MIEQEEILLDTNRTGVTFYTFSTKAFNKMPVNEEQYGGPFPSYVVYNNMNQPLGLFNFDGVNLVGMNTNHNYVPLSQLSGNFVTGYSIVNIIDSNLDQDEIEEKIDLGLERLADPIKNPQGIGATNYMFYKKHTLNDMFINVKMERSYNSLDTLRVFNNLVNSIPIQEAKTGVVFGSLVASQQIQDENGLTVKIPLANVPIGIFNKSETFPSTTSVDEDGNRISLNLTQSSQFAAYFNPESLAHDLSYVQNGSAFTVVPDQYKYITRTNENGEFIIYDVPIGEQVLIFEVDLFKQGMTKDEIQHNFFPFPVNENPNIDNIPSFFFRQVPIDVFPAWGTSQTGYTEVDINVNLDLRKWTTYIFAPAAYGNEKLETSTARNAANTFKIEILDMTSEGFVQKPVEVVQIVNDLDRQDDDQYLWYDEFKSKRKRLEYSQFGCHVLKLPGNLYDPKGFKTNKDGVPTGAKGVWLAAYQFSCYVNPLRCIRNTGNYRWTPNRALSHFKLNYTAANAGPGNITGPQVGTDPYRKRWSLTYPDQYHIPPKPVGLRYLYDAGRTYSSPVILEEPAYSDGDLVGWVYQGTAGGKDVGGFGLQVAENVWFPNRIAAVATVDFMYKYERGVAWNEEYANGYQPYWDGGATGYGPWTSGYWQRPALAGMSSVPKGETYQRLECGYGYFMKYQDWGIVYKWPWVTDKYWSPGEFGSVNILPHPVNMWNIDDNNYAFAFDQLSSNQPYLGGIDIYRIVKSGTENITIPTQFIIPTYAMMSFGGSANRLQNMNIRNDGIRQVKIKNQFRSEVWVEGNSSALTNLWVEKDDIIVLDPGGYIVIDATPRKDLHPTHARYNVWNQLNPQGTVENTELTFEGNFNFNTTSNKFDEVRYDIQIQVTGGVNNPESPPYWNGAYSNLTFWSKNATTNPSNSKSKIVSVATASKETSGETDGVNEDSVGGNKTKYMYRVSITNTV